MLIMAHHDWLAYQYSYLLSYLITWQFAHYDIKTTWFTCISNWYCPYTSDKLLSMAMHTKINYTLIGILHPAAESDYHQTSRTRCCHLLSYIGTVVFQRRHFHRGLLPAWYIQQFTTVGSITFNAVDNKTFNIISQLPKLCVKISILMHVGAFF